MLVVLGVPHVYAKGGSEKISDEEVLEQYGIHPDNAGIEAALGNESPLVREVAVRLVARRGRSAATPTLAALLRDADGSVRISAADALLGFGDTRGVPILRGELHAEPPVLRLRAAAVLCEHGHADGHAAIAELLSVENPTLQVLALAALLSCRTFPRRLEALSVATKDPSMEVRIQALDVVSKQAKEIAVPILLTALDDPAAEVRYTADQRLQRMTAGNVGYEPWGTSVNRAAGAARWNSWWSTHHHAHQPSHLKPRK